MNRNLISGAQWRPKVLLALLVALNLPAWGALTQLWSTNIGYSHGWLIIAMSLWALFSDVTPLTLVRETPTRWLARLSPLIALCAVWIFCHFAYVSLSEELLLPVTALVCAWILFGKSGLRVVAFPALFLVFAIPLWDELIPALQSITVAVVGHTLPLIGIVTHIDGINIDIATGVFVVEPGCAGSHFLIVALALSIWNAKRWRLKFNTAIIGISLAAFLALFANWLRVFLIIAQAYSSDMQTHLIKDHYWFGWGLFAATLGVYFILIRYLDDGERPVKPSKTEAHQDSATRLLIQAAYLIFILGATLLLIKVQDARQAALKPVLVSAPTFSGEWEGPRLVDLAWVPAFPNPAASSTATYKHDGSDLSWYQAVYTHEQVGTKLIGYGSTVVPDDWKVLKTVDYTSPWNRKWIEVRGQGMNWLIGYRYSVGNKNLTSALRVKLAQGLEGFNPYGPAASKVDALAAPCTISCDQAHALLVRFSEKMERLDD